VSERSPSAVPHTIRRRPRETLLIELPAPGERPEAPNVRSHAKIFALSLLAIVALGTLLLATPWTTESGTATSFDDALFTAVSAAAVTGLVTVDTQAHWNFAGELVILCLIQAGGLGFMVGASLVLQTLRRGQTRLSDAILIQNGAPTLSLQEAGYLARRIVRFTAVTEACGALLLTARFARDMPLPEALWHGTFHAISAFCNAGFDLQGGYLSLIPYQTSVWVNVVLMLLIQAGALSYMALADVAAHRRWAPLALDTKLVLVGNAVLLVGGAVLFLAAEWSRVLIDMPAASSARRSSLLSQLGLSSTTVIGKKMAGKPIACSAGSATVTWVAEPSSKLSSTGRSGSGVPNSRWSTSCSARTGVRPPSRSAWSCAVRTAGGVVIVRA
jgi:Trk-type K+ transport system membrane component